MTNYLDTDVSSIDTSFPRLQKGLYELSCTAAELLDNKAGTGKNLKLQFKTTQSGYSTSGEQVAPGYNITTFVALTPTPKYTEQMIAKNLASLMKSADMSGSPRAVIDNPATLVGKVVNATVAVQPANDGYAESNKISNYIVKM